jgi:hypothetical protein
MFYIEPAVKPGVTALPLKLASQFNYSTTSTIEKLLEKFS